MCCVLTFSCELPLAGLTLAQWLLTIGVVAFSGFLRGFLGFGSSMIIVMVMSAMLGPLAAVPIAGLAGLLATVQLVPTAIKHGERDFILIFSLACFAAAPFGAWVLVVINPTYLNIIISVLVLIMTGMMYSGWRMRDVHDRRVFFFVGFTAGVLQGGAAIGGPAAVAVALARPGKVERQRGNVVGGTNALVLCVMPAFAYLELYTQDVLIIGTSMAPVYWGMTTVGALYFNAGGKDLYRHAALLALVLTGLITLGYAVIKI
ncbi:MAG: hypothetical protein CBB68_13375 [Rhodospirillaceae bacterium TMED8]|nr:hypothetical protein [Magnetovibrio sp.]OUT48552.1 MAG: hypothetical protein CBB68_13375 [Rhodospirillaceae bacterium TMED8]|tara:strand:+ start:615 stop:1397 length:783 start_codon:yes stop_codon:yes gene_type:complete